MRTPDQTDVVKGTCGELLRMLNSHRALLRALAIPAYMNAAHQKTNLFDEMNRFVKGLWTQASGIEALVAAHEDTMQQVRAEQEQQRISATRLHDQLYQLKESLLALHAAMESKSSPGAEDAYGAKLDGANTAGAADGAESAVPLWARLGIVDLHGHFDADGDGELNAAELDAFFEALGDKRGDTGTAAGSSCTAEGVAALSISVGCAPGPRAAGLLPRTLLRLYEQRWGGVAQLRRDMEAAGYAPSRNESPPPLTLLRLMHTDASDAREEIERMRRIKIAYAADMAREHSAALGAQTALETATKRTVELEAALAREKGENESLRVELSACRARANASESAAERQREELENCQRGLVEMNELLQRKLAQKEYLQRALWQAEQSYAALRDSMRDKQEGLWKAELAQQRAEKDNRLLHIAAKAPRAPAPTWT